MGCFAMSLHSFDPVVASRVGVNAAVIYQNILFWTRKNLANSKHIRDGKVWTYNSVKALNELFDYLSPAQIRTAIGKLLDAGLIFEANHNPSAYDRTKWYGVPCEIHLSKIANGFVEDRKPIPDSKPDQKPDALIDGVCVFDVFNSIAQDAGWPTVQARTPAREAAAKARMSECGGFDAWREAMQRAAKSRFLTGKATGTSPASFDWLHKPSNFARLMEGNYDDRYSASRPVSEGRPHRADPALEQIARLAGLGQA
jgi:hypothetical protein